MANYFLAFHLVEHPLGDLIRSQWDPMQLSSEKIRWTPANNIHITLLYFGKLAEEERQILIQELPEVLNDFSTIDVTVSGSDFFNNKERTPAVLLIDSPTQQLELMHQKVFDKFKHLLNNNASRGNHHFNGHVTLARTKKVTSEIKTFFENLADPLKGQVFHMNQLVLMHHDPKLHKYIIDHEFILDASGRETP